MISRSSFILSYLFAFLVLFGSFGTITTTSAQFCVDDNFGLATIAEIANLDNTDCEDSIEFCDSYDAIEGTLVRNMCCETCACSSGVCVEPFCADVDGEIVSVVAAAAGYSGITDCSALGGSKICDSNKELGSIARGLCCATCGSSGGSFSGPITAVDDAVAETRMPPVADDNGKNYPPVQLFLVGGQSECVGGAMSSDLKKSDKYDELKGVIDGVWFAGYDEYASPDRFFIAPLSASVDRNKFGPELTFGQRIRAAFKKNNQPRQRVMMVKYCVGGTNANTHWNPDSLANSWNRNQDDGTSRWLEDNGDLLFLPVQSSKNYLFKNMAYTIRRTEEALTEAGISYKWSSIVWLQGGGDKSKGVEDPMLWKTFGEDTARVFNGFREELGSAVPIVDTGGGSNNQLLSGKEYAMQIVDGCQATSIDFPNSANDDTLAATSTCVQTAGNPCLDAPGRYINYAMMDYYGYDPRWPNPPANSKTFNWWVKFPSNLHSAYELMILKGQMMANEYLRVFTDYNLDSFEDDIATLFPFESCPGNSLPSENNLCWIDYRNEKQMKGNLCPPILSAPKPAQNPVASVSIPTSSPPTQKPAPNPVASPVSIPTSSPPTQKPAPIPGASPVRIPTSSPPTQKPAPNPVASPVRIPTSSPPTQKPDPNPVATGSASINNPTTSSPTEFATSSPTAFGTGSPTEIPITGIPATNPSPLLDLTASDGVVNSLSGILFSPENSQSESSAANMNHAMATSDRWWLVMVFTVGIIALTGV